MAIPSTVETWRVLVAFHLAETKEQAVREALDGLWWWHNEYKVRVLGMPGATQIEDRKQLLEQVSGEGGSGVGSAVIGTPDEMVNMIRHLQEITGGFGVLLGFAHDWAGREATLRSWELFARHVVPELNGYTRNLKASAELFGRSSAGARRRYNSVRQGGRRRGQGCASGVSDHDGKTKRPKRCLEKDEVMMGPDSINP